MRKAFIQLHIAVLLAGFTGILGKLITLNEGLLVWYRLFITTVSLWLLVAIRRQNIRISRIDLWRIIGIGGIAAMHWLFFYGSIKYSNVSIALLSFSAIGFFTAIIEPLILRHRLDLVELLLGLLVIVGIFFIFKADQTYKTGIWIGLISSLLASLFPVLNKRMLRRIPAETVTLYELSGGCLVLTALMPLYLWLFPTPSLLPGWANLAWLLVLAWACTVLAFNLGLLALQKISAFTVSLTYNLEPIYGILLAFAVFREDKYFSKGFYLGLGIILASIALQTLRLARNVKKTAMVCLFGLFFSYGGFAQSRSSDPVDKLKDYFAKYDPERAFVEFDRPDYAPGDTVFFKVFVTHGGSHALSGLSGILHVDLIDPGNTIARSILLRLEGGVSWGEFPLSDSVQPGNYRLRAYTEWMRNQGESGFFDRYIPVQSRTDRHRPGGKGSLQFFPEGGALVENIKTRIAFKAVDADGMGADVRGVVLDKENKQVCTFESSHLGMGYFYLYPDKGNTYRAKYSFSDGSEAVVDLPEPDSSGMSLSVDNDSARAISMTVKSNSVYFKANRNKEFLLVIYSGGKAMRYSLRLEDRSVTLDLDKKVLQTGICKITLFSPDGQPMCERLLYVKNDDLLALQMQTDKPGYGKGEKINLTLKARTAAGLPVVTHFSVSVVDEGRLPPNGSGENNIEAGLLLAADLKANVEQPNYYFNDTSDAAKKNLDLLLLTQTYRNVNWPSVLASDSGLLIFPPEKALEIAGTITDLSQKPIMNGTITLLPSNRGSLLSSKSDSNGLFHFPNLVFTDTLHAVLSATNAKGNNSTRITCFMVTHPPPPVHALRYTMPDGDDSGRFSTAGRGKVLKAVTVKASKEENQYRTVSLAGAGYADQVMHSEEIQKLGSKLSTSLNGRLRGVDFIGAVPYLSGGIQSNTTSGVRPMLIVLDGTPITPGSEFAMDDIPVEHVETVEVLRSGNTSYYGMEGANGVLIITTKNGSETQKANTAVGVLPVAAAGFYKARPYTETTAGSIVYWNPEIKTDKGGNASLDFLSAGHAGTYKVVVEGVDNNGNIGRMIYRYKVE